jgi:hypothetical protein
MTPRKGSQSVSNGYLKLVAALIAGCCVVVAVYALKDQARTFFTYSHRADAAAVHHAVDSVCTVLQPRNVSTSTVAVGDCRVRRDRIQLERNGSIIRANHLLTRAVEKAGGVIVAGVESTDQGRRWQIVTLSISDGDSIIREVALEKRVR